MLPLASNAPGPLCVKSTLRKTYIRLRCPDSCGTSLGIEIRLRAGKQRDRSSDSIILFYKRFVLDMSATQLPVQSTPGDVSTEVQRL